MLYVVVWNGLKSEPHDLDTCLDLWARMMSAPERYPNEWPYVIEYKVEG